MNRLKSIFYEEVNYYNEKKVDSIINKLYKNKYLALYLLLCAIFLYNLVFKNKISEVVFLLIADFIYDDIMLAINKSYKYTKLKCIIYFVYFGFGIGYLGSLIWNNLNSLVCLIATIITTSIYLYIIKKVSYRL